MGTEEEENKLNSNNKFLIHVASEFREAENMPFLKNTDLTRRVKAPEGNNCDFKALTDSAGLFMQF